MKIMSKATGLILAAFLIVLTAVGLASYYVWLEMGVISLGFHGWLAVILGSLGSIILGAGLMWLSFYSNRQGYDDRAGEFDEDERP